MTATGIEPSSIMANKSFRSCSFRLSSNRVHTLALLTLLFSTSSRRLVNFHLPLEGYLSTLPAINSTRSRSDLPPLGLSSSSTFDILRQRSPSSSFIVARSHDEVGSPTRRRNTNRTGFERLISISRVKILTNAAAARPASRSGFEALRIGICYLSAPIPEFWSIRPWSLMGKGLPATRGSGV